MLRACWLVLGLLGPLVLGSCAEGRMGKPLPVDDFQYPTGLAVHPAGYALIASSNFDLAYIKGALHAVDLNRLAAELALPLEQRSGHPTYRNTIVTEQGIGLNNFAGSVVLSDDGQLAVVAVRETNELVLVDVEVAVAGGQAELQLSCWPGSSRPEGDFPECSGSHHRLELSDDDPYDLLLRPQPDIGGYLLWVTFLRSGNVAAIDLPPPAEGVPQQLYSLETDVSGTSDLALAPATGLIFVTSRFPDPQSNPIHFFDPELGAEAEMGSVDLFELLLGNETRSIAFGSDGLTAGLVMRNPDMLVLLDTSLDYAGVPRNDFLGSIGLAANPSRVNVLDDLFFVTGAQDDTLFVVDGRSRRLLAVREDVCRGPFEVEFWERGDLRWALVSCFEEGTLAVLDADRDSATFLEVLARVGEPHFED
jgi:DNA-binding beta-propeller fold protein YncE